MRSCAACQPTKAARRCLDGPNPHKAGAAISRFRVELLRGLGFRGLGV